MQKALKAIVKVGETMGADRLIQVNHVHVSGISYYNIGEAGYKFIELLYNSKVRTVVYSTLNPLGMDIEKWKEMKIHEEFANKQLRIVQMLLEMGFERSFTCTPYILRPPARKEHLAWAESSAVGMANTYYGAYTNREAGPLALFSSLVGRTYYAGLHIEENRRPNVKVILNELERWFAIDKGIASSIGYVIGEKISDAIPLIPLKYKPSFEVIKAYTAAAAATGSIALTYIENITPDFSKYNHETLERIEIDKKEIEKIMEDREVDISKIDVIFIGCPHATVEEILDFLNDVKDCRKLKIKVIVSTSSFVYSYLENNGLIPKLIRLGVDIIKDTCPIVSPAFYSKYKRIATYSGKALFYLPRQQNQPTSLISSERMWGYICEK